MAIGGRMKKSIYPFWYAVALSPCEEQMLLGGPNTAVGAVTKDIDGEWAAWLLDPKSKKYRPVGGAGDIYPEDCDEYFSVKMMIEAQSLVMKAVKMYYGLN
jgi:hypothetical protein